MLGRLYDNYAVSITPKSLGSGGSWGKAVNGDVHAYNAVALSFFHKRLLKVPSVYFIDVGANTGAFTLLAAVLPLSTVYALEPNREVRQILEENIARNRETNTRFTARVYPYAAWSTREKIGFHPFPAAHGFSRVRHSFETGGGMSYEVQGITLDEFVEQEMDRGPDFLKIDVEGAEKYVLDGAHNVLKGMPGILMEWWPPHCKHFGYHPDEIDSFLKEMGYSKQQVTNSFVYYEQEATHEGA